MFIKMIKIPSSCIEIGKLNYKVSKESVGTGTGIGIPFRSVFGWLPNGRNSIPSNHLLHWAIAGQFY